MSITADSVWLKAHSPMTASVISLENTIKIVKMHRERWLRIAIHRSDVAIRSGWWIPKFNSPFRTGSQWPRFKTGHMAFGPCRASHTPSQLTSANYGFYILCNKIISNRIALWWMQSTRCLNRAIWSTIKVETDKMLLFLMDDSCNK